MARTNARPGRTVAVFFIVLAIAYGLVALVGTWKPALGLDLEGGTQIQLTAKGNSIKKDQLDEAANIIDERVNGSGVSEAEVTTQGSNMIVVQIPGSSKNASLVDTVTRQAQLRFRLVAQVTPTTTPQTPLPSDSPSATQQPGVGVTLPPSTSPSASQSDKPKDKSTNNGGNNRTPALLGKTKHDPKKNKNDKNKPSSSPSASPTANAPDSTSDVNYTDANKKAYSDELNWITNPDPQSVAVYNAFTCPAKTPVVDDPSIPIVTCSEEPDPTTGQYEKYLLSPAVIEGTQISSAAAIAPGSTQGQVKWTVQLKLKKEGADEQLKLSQAMVGDQNKLTAIVLDGKVVTATYFSDVIPDGTSQIERQLHRGRREEPGDEPEVRRSPDQLRLRQDHQPGHRPVAGGRPAERGHHRGPRRSHARDDLLPALLPRPRSRRDRVALGRRAPRRTPWCCCWPRARASP